MNLNFEWATESKVYFMKRVILAVAVLRGLRERFGLLRLFLLILGVLALLASPAWASVTLTQSASTGASSAALSVSLPSNTTAGHLLIVAVFYAGGATSGVTINACDGGSCGTTCATSTDSFTALPNMPVYTGNREVYVAYAQASGALTSFTACGNQGSHSMMVAVYEYASTTGWQSSPLDTSNTNTNTGTTGNGGSITPAASGELIFSAIGIQAAVTGMTVSGTGMTNQPTSSGAASTGWARGGVAFTGDGCDDENSGNTSTTCTFSWTGSNGWGAAIAAFRPAAPSGQVTTFATSNVNVTSASTTGSISLDLSSLGSSNNYLLVGISIVQNTAASTPTVSSIKWGGSGGTALTQVCSAAETASTSNWVSMGIWALQNPSTISSTVVVTLSGSTVFQAGAAVFTNVASLGTCVTQTHKGGDAVSSTSVTVAAPGTGGAVFDTLAVESIVSISSFSMTPTAGQTSLWNVVDTSNPPGGANCNSGGCSAGGAGSWAGNVSTMSYSFPGPSLSNSAYGAVPLIAASTPSNKRTGQTIVGRLDPVRGKAVPATAVD